MCADKIFLACCSSVVPLNTAAALAAVAAAAAAASFFAWAAASAAACFAAAAAASLLNLSIFAARSAIAFGSLINLVNANLSRFFINPSASAVAISIDFPVSFTTPLIVVNLFAKSVCPMSFNFAASNVPDV